MTFTASDPRKEAAGPPCGWAMTVFELAIYIAVHRSTQPVAAEALSETLEGWFEQLINPADISTATTGMIDRGWLLQLGNGLKAAEQGRQATQPLVNGVIRMLDQGTRLIDVALMMSVLRLTKEELDHAHV